MAQSYSIPQFDQNNFMSTLLNEIHSYSRTQGNIYLKDAAGHTVAILPQEDFELWLSEDTDELMWPMYVYDRDLGITVDAGYTRASVDEFWGNYNYERRLHCLRTYANEHLTLN